MMYGEFLELSGQEITVEQYDKVIEPMYMATEMSKRDFISFMMPTIKALAKQNRAAEKAEREAKQELVFISDGSVTDDCCYWTGWFAKVVDVDADIRTGKTIYKVRALTDEEVENECHCYSYGVSGRYINSYIDIDLRDDWKKVKKAA